MPLTIGDHVTLADNFDANNKEGWCLGSAGNAKEGVVIFAPSTTGSDSEQRDIGVASRDNLSQVYWFRANWLKRTRNAGRTVYSLGDRVQLDVSMWAPGKTETSGKCLGTPVDGAYGIVCGVGSMRDGIVRNIEVRFVFVNGCGGLVFVNKSLILVNYFSICRSLL